MKVYKYRSIDEESFNRDIKTLRKNAFFASNYSMLNDPFDIYFNEEISKFIALLKDLFPIEQLNDFENQFKKFLNYKEEIGVYCLSKDYLNEQLWAYYASSYTGYCIEYDLDKLCDKGENFDFQYQFDIDYLDKIPTLVIEDIIQRKDSFIKKMFATKKSNWKHEDEIRLIFDKFGVKKFHSSAVTGIYFGVKTPEDIRKLFYDLFEGRDVKFYEVFPSNFQLDCKLINETKRFLKYDISKFNFEIIRHRQNSWEEIFDIFYVGNSNNENELKEFLRAFREKKCTKDSTIYLYNNSEIKNILEIYPKDDKQYLQLAESLIMYAYNDDEDIKYYPYKDLKYDEIIKKP